MRNILISFSIILLCSCASQSRTESTELDKSINKYLNFDGQKAFALAVDETGAWASGYSYSYPAQELANDRAVQECEQHRDKLAVKADCVIYYQGNTKVMSYEIQSNSN